MESFLCAVTMLSLGMSASALVGAVSPVGLWRTFDDNGKESSVVEISEKNGKLQGKILGLIHSAEPNPVCDKCQGENKNQPVIGMVILWDMARDGDGWSGGRVLDPENGKEYRCKIELKESGAKLEVRGFVGLSFFGRSQIWIRQEPQKSTKP